MALAKNSFRSGGIVRCWPTFSAGAPHGRGRQADQGDEGDPSSDDFANCPRSPGCVVPKDLWAGLVDAAKIAVLIGDFAHKRTAEPLVAILIHPKVSIGIIGWTHNRCKGENVGATLPPPTYDIFAAGCETSHIGGIGAALAAIRTGRGGG